MQCRRFRISSFLVSALLSACVRAPGHQTTSRICAAAPRAEAEEPLYTVAREILTSPDWSDFRREHVITGEPGSVAWVTDDRVCRQVVAAIGPQAQAAGASIPVVVIQAGNFYMARVHPLSQGTVLDAQFKVLTVFVSR